MEEDPEKEVRGSGTWRGWKAPPGPGRKGWGGALLGCLWEGGSWPGGQETKSPA